MISQMIRRMLYYRFFLLLFCCGVNFIVFGQQTGNFVVKGNLDTYFPVTFTDANWNNNVATVLQLGRSNVHTDAQWRGSLISTFTFHVTDWGNGSNYIDADIRSLTFKSGDTTSFIAGWSEVGTHGNRLWIIWLRGGNTTYYFSANSSVSPIVYDGVQNSLPFISNNGSSYSFKSQIDEYVNYRGKNIGDQLSVAGYGTNYLRGKLGIGTKNTGTNALAVNGTAIFTKALVKAYGNWPDYVFDNNYQLKSLDSVETFIRQNRHLPDMPSAHEMKGKELDLADNQILLLRKIEELTLYLIEVNKKLEAQDKVIKEQQLLIERKAERKRKE